MIEAPARCAVHGHGAVSQGAALVRRAVATVLAGEARHADITVTFLGPRPMRDLNAQHLGHARPTDVISFTLPQPDASVVGDVYICRYVVARHARAHGCSVREELLRVIVHGVLHVLGHDHADDATRTTGAMWQLQERYVAMLRCPN